jgi:hypothetical protein
MAEDGAGAVTVNAAHCLQHSLMLFMLFLFDAQPPRLLTSTSLMTAQERRLNSLPSAFSTPMAAGSQVCAGSFQNQIISGLIVFSLIFIYHNYARRSRRTNNLPQGARERVTVVAGTTSPNFLWGENPIIIL